MVKYEINLENLIDYVNGDNSKLKKMDNFINIGIEFLFPGNTLTKFLILLKDILTNLNLFNKQSKEKESLDNDSKCKNANIVLAKLALKDTINEIFKGTKRNRANWKMNLNPIENNFKNGNIKPESYLEQSISVLLELETLKNIDKKKELIEKSKENLKAYKNTLITESQIYATFSNNSNEKEQDDYSNLYITIEEFEKKLVESTEPSINLEFFNYKDNSFIKNLEPKLNSKAIYVQSREKEEAIYYIIYLLKNNYPEEIERTWIIESIDNWNELEGKVEGKLLISNFNSNEIKLITNNTCIFSHSSSDFIPFRTSLINLSPRVRRNMVDDLANNIGDYPKAHEIIMKTNGLFSSFKRLVYHGKSEPIWNNFEKKELMIPALLIGQWETCKKDKESLEILAKQSFEEYITRLNSFIKKEDPFLLEYLNKSKYKLANIDEAWVILKGYITAEDLENFKIIFLSIFSEIPENFKLPPERWNIISLSDKSSQYSPMLKKGVIQSLIKLSDVEENRDFVDNLIEDIFKEINTKEEWLNISEYLPDLMEASPKILLKILHDEVEKSDSPFWSLFTNRSKDISFWGMNYYTSVLWALELALCFENFAIDSLEILVKIAEKNMEYKISNSPLNTLYTALSAWFHEINISISKKIKFVENTIKKESPISQDILNSILPNRNSTQSFSPMHKPQLKTYELVVSNITQQDIDNTYKEYIKIAVKNAELDLDKWLLIFEKLDFFDLSFEKEVFAGIQKTILSLKTDEEKYFLKERIREIIYKNRCYPTATWALEEEKIKLIEEKIFNKIKLSEKSFDYFYLFSKGRPQFLNPKYKFDKTLKNSNSEYSEYLKEIRIKAIKDIVNCNFSKENILKFISNLRKFNINDIYSNRHIGSIIGSFLEVNEETIELIIKLGEKNENDVLIEITKVLYSKNGQDLNFIKTLINSSISDITKSSIITLIDLNQEVVEILSSSNESIKREYWKSIHIPSLKEVEVEKNYIWQNLLRYSNFTQAYYFLEENFTLFRAIEYLEFYKQSNESTTDQMESYYIEEIFKKIYKISESNISTEEKNIIVSFEFYYIMILSNYHNNNSLPKYIREIFVTDPHMLAEVIKNAYQLDRSDLNNTVIIENSYKILFKLKVCPSEREKGKIDEKELLEWVKTYCEIISNNNQLEIGMQKLGECFAYSPPGTDGIFPHEAVRTVFENYTDENLKKGFIIGVYNKRGVYIGTSGSNEIEISKEYKKYAEATRIDFPNISRALLSISERYRKEGEHERELAINDL